MAWVRELFSPRWRWLTISVMWLAVVILAQLGLAAIRPPISLWDRIYMIPSLFTTGFSDELAAADWRVQTARFIGPLVFASTFLVATAGIFRDQFGRLRLRFRHGHVVVAGLGEKGARLAASYVDAGRKVAGIDTNPANPHLVTLRRLGVIVVVGDATQVQVLGDAGVDRAADLVAVTGADATNVAVLGAARDLPRRSAAGRLAVAVHLVDSRLARLLRTRELTGMTESTRSEFFNVSQRGARLWLVDADPFRPDPQGRSPHVVVVGLGPLGASVVVQAVQRWHTRDAADDRTLRVTAADARAAAWLAAVSFEHPRFARWARVDTVDLDPLNPTGDAVAEFRALLSAGSVTDVFVALDDESSAMTAALLIRHGLAGNRTAINVSTRSAAGLSALVTDPGGDDPIPIRPYAVIDHTCTADAISGGTNEQVAMAIHDDYLIRARAEGRQGRAVRSWDELDEQDRDANRQAAAGLVTALRAAGYLPIPAIGWDHETFRFGDADIDAIARAEHERWMASRQAEGWRFGENRDDARKLNPAMVPWSDVSEADRAFNQDYVRQVPAMLARSGFELVRLGQPSPT